MPLDGARLKTLRELKGIRTQLALAVLVEVSQSHIWDLEKGKLRNPDVFVRVADELECTTDFLFRRGPFKNADKPKSLRQAANRMALDSFLEQYDVAPLQRERCGRVLGHADAPVTAKGWKSLLEMIDRAIGPTNGQSKLRAISGGKAG